MAHLRLAQHRIRTIVLVSLAIPLAAAGCGSPAHPSSAPPAEAATRPAVSPGPDHATPLLSTGLVDQTPAEPTPAVAPGSATVTTRGSGSVSGTPGIMTLSIGVTTTSVHAGEALTDSSTKANAVQQTLRNAGVAAADIQTSQLSLSPTYSNNSSTPNGYQATNMVTAKLRDLSKAGKVIDDAVTAAGDAGRLEGVSFSIDDSSAFASAARKMAVAQARRQADELAAAAGMKVAGLRSISEDSAQTPYRSAGGAVPSSAQASAPVPIQPGVQQTTVDVSAVWNLTPA
jgi:uncharacterized protein